VTEAPGTPADRQVVILAGGLGTRARILTGDAPKALVPVGGKPFVHHQLALLASQRARRVLYCIGYGGDQIRRFVGDGSEWGLEVSYVDEGADLRGTGGVLRTAFDVGALDEAFAVLYGDSYLPIELEPIWTAFAAVQQPALMTVLRNEDRWDRSNVVLEDGLAVAYDKSPAARDPRMAWIDYGLTVLERELIGEHLPSGVTLDLSALYRLLSRERRLAGFEVRQRFYEVGSPEGVADLERFLAGQTVRAL
jgi:MurNAc alpha-1-phosphate uridylyltransferase